MGQVNEPALLEARPSGHAPWVFGAACLLFALCVAVFAWRRDIRREEAGRTYIQEAMRKHIAAADTLMARSAQLEAKYAKEYADFEEAFASLERLELEAQARINAVAAIPSDSLGAHIRMLLASARSRGLLPPR